MNDKITAGAMVLMVDLTTAAKLARWWVSPVVEPGRHRRSRAAEMVDEVVPLDELLAYEAEYETPYGAAVAQGWRWCPNCCRSEPAVLNRDGWLCGHCLEPAPDTTTTNT